MKRCFILAGCVLTMVTAQSQLHIQPGAQLFIEKGQTLFAEGDLTSFADVQGLGNIALMGGLSQHINTNGFRIPHLYVNNKAGVILTGTVLIAESLNLLKGHLQCGGHRLELGEQAMVNTIGPNSFISTGANGYVRKFLSKDLSHYRLPVANGKNYAPIELTTSGKYAFAYIDVSALGSASRFKPIQTEDYLTEYWAINRVGITGSVTATVHYGQVNAVTGNENKLSGFYWNGHIWVTQSTPINPATNTISAAIPPGAGEIYAMTKSIVRSIQPHITQLIPNPAKNTTVLHISSPTAENANMYLTDASGQLINKITLHLRMGDNQHAIPISGLSKGRYQIFIEAESQKQTLSLIKL